MDKKDWPVEQQLALAHASGAHKQRLAVFLALDRRLGQFVGQSNELILTQMRIAWWRDQFAKPSSDRPAGDPILDDISSLWAGEEQALTMLVDGWEALLAEPPLPDEATMEFVMGRAECFAALARFNGSDAASATHCGVMWALGDLASRISDQKERDVVGSLAAEQCDGSLAVSYSLRSLRILGSLGIRFFKNPTGQLLGGRRDIAHVMRLGLLGR